MKKKHKPSKKDGRRTGKLSPGRGVNQANGDKPAVLKAKGN